MRFSALGLYGRVAMLKHHSIIEVIFYLFIISEAVDIKVYISKFQVLQMPQNVT